MRLGMAVNFSRFGGLMSVSIALLLAAMTVCGICGVKAAPDAMSALFAHGASGFGHEPANTSPSEEPLPGEAHHCCSPVLRLGGLSVRADSRPEPPPGLPPSPGPAARPGRLDARKAVRIPPPPDRRAPYWSVFASTQRMLS